jgi:hypothetical protein
MSELFKILRFIAFTVLVLLALSGKVHAEEVFGSFGVGVFNSAKSYPSEVRDIYVGWRKPIAQGTYFQAKGGMWADAGGSGRTNSGFFSAGPGMLVDLRPIQIRAGIGATFVTNPDTYLGGPFALNEEVYIGLKDPVGNSIGIVYDHISNAGMYQNNMGRDMVSFQIGQEF